MTKKPLKNKKLSRPILTALAAYYFHKDRQYNSSLPEKFIWDKTSDLDYIFKLMKKDGYKGIQASVGTFWFNNGKAWYEINETNYPVAVFSSFVEGVKK